MPRKYRVGNLNFFDHRGFLHPTGSVVTWPAPDEPGYSKTHHEPARGFGWTQLLTQAEVQKLDKDDLERLQEGNELPVPDPKPQAEKALGVRVHELSEEQKHELRQILLNEAPTARSPVVPAPAPEAPAKTLFGKKSKAKDED